MLRTLFAKPLAAAVFLTLNGVILLAGERLRRRIAPVPAPVPEGPGAARARILSSRRLDTLAFGGALLIGACQVLAFFAGISRSGVTMVAGLARGLSHEDAARFAFLLATRSSSPRGCTSCPTSWAPTGTASAARSLRAAMLRRAQLALALQTALAVAVVLALVGAVAALFVVHDEGVSADRLLADATSPPARDDVTDPPPGVTLFLVGADGRVLAATPGRPTALLDRRGLAATPGHPRYTDRTFDGGHYRVLTVAEPGEARLVQAALDRGPQAAERRRLLGAALVAGLCGIIAAGVVGALLARRAVAPLGEAIQRQRRFVADASHELRTPLTLLHTRAQLLRRYLAAGELGHVGGEVAALERDAASMGEVAEDLLISAELHSGHGERLLVDLGALAAEVAEAARGHATTAEVSLVTELEPAWVQGAPSALRRVVLSLVDNAIGHARRPGGEVRLRVTASARQALLEVCDNGPGVDPSGAARMFERFAHGPASDARRRFGLGLALVREVVDAHDGHIEVAGRSGPGHGASFRVRLPAAPSPPDLGQTAHGVPGTEDR